MAKKNVVTVCGNTRCAENVRGECLTGGCKRMAALQVERSEFEDGDADRDEAWFQELCETEGWTK